MGTEPNYHLELYPGMRRDFALYSSRTDIDAFLAKNLLQNPYFFLGINSGDWTNHIQVRHDDDADLIMQHLDAKEIKESWSWDKDRCDTDTDASILKAIEEDEATIRQNPDDEELRQYCLNNIKYWRQRLPSRKRAWKPLPCFWCSEREYYKSADGENVLQRWIDQGILVNGHITQCQEKLRPHETCGKLVWHNLD